LQKGQRRALSGMMKEHEAARDGMNIRYPLEISMA
jgi:hypothetical protein